MNPNLTLTLIKVIDVLCQNNPESSFARGNLELAALIQPKINYQVNFKLASVQLILNPTLTQDYNHFLELTLSQPQVITNLSQRPTTSCCFSFKT